MKNITNSLYHITSDDTFKMVLISVKQFLCSTQQQGEDTTFYWQTFDGQQVEKLAYTVGPCTLAQSDHLWGHVVTKPVILSKKGIDMTWCRYIGLQYNQRSAF